MYASLLIGLAVTVAAPEPKAPPKKEAPLIVGEWTGEKLVVGGKEVPVPEGGVSITFKADGKLVVKEGTNDPKDGGKFKMDTKKSPAEIDIEPAEAGSPPGKGIFKIDGDTLTISVTLGADVKRASQFESPEGSPVMLLTLKRAKKK